MDRPGHSNARLALQKYGFREFMILSSLDNVYKATGIILMLVCSLDVRFQHVHKTLGILMIVV